MRVLEALAKEHEVAKRSVRSRSAAIGVFLEGFLPTSRSKPSARPMRNCRTSYAIRAAVRLSRSDQLVGWRASRSSRWSRRHGSPSMLLRTRMLDDPLSEGHAVVVLIDETGASPCTRRGSVRSFENLRDHLPEHCQFIGTTHSPFSDPLPSDLVEHRQPRIRMSSRSMRTRVYSKISPKIVMGVDLEPGA